MIATSCVPRAAVVTNQTTTPVRRGKATFARGALAALRSGGGGGAYVRDPLSGCELRLAVAAGRAGEEGEGGGGDDGEDDRAEEEEEQQQRSGDESSIDQFEVRARERETT